ncbi:DegV family protein [Pseudolactococcus paracarnosus]|uniref:DegV family protein n=1 Tax=Pseudolactococcus paracarnosus TaxID=2749962 RepID=A0ABT0AND8_9LACT|nr:DegV family protein [Lactococcus paracarnosus]MCJ1977993.1 DegV family protein [Lactococcus paracarnosus]MCJ1984175.1 DegV family protein [Lactococcus paracarnosus]MCJ1998278.1 DegV family protein [Lactococcus paracarnosus]
MTIKIVTDSTITVDPELIEKYNITIVPLAILIDGVLYQDTDLSAETFMTKMKASKHLPKTSQPPVGVFTEVYDRLSEDGSQIISIHLTKALSGTVEAARQGAMLSNAEVTVIDSDFIDQGLRFQVVEAAKLAAQGASKEDIIAATIETKNNTELYIGIANLDNLVKGGRVNRVTGVLSGLLNIKIVMEFVDNNLQPMLKGRGNKTFQKWLDDFMTKISGRKVKHIGISHAENLTFAQHMRDQLQPFVTEKISVLDTNSTVATHTGPGAWALLIEFEANS